jgi:hypothetical protein
MLAAGQHNHSSPAEAQMAQVGKHLAVGDTGPYAELAARPLPDGLVLLFIPSLAAIVARAEQLKGAPLTRDEVIRLRDHSAVIVSDPEPARAVEERRGYVDLDPADPWGSWLTLHGRSE